MNNVNAALSKFPELAGLGIEDLNAKVGTAEVPADIATAVRNNGGWAGGRTVCLPGNVGEAAGNVGEAAVHLGECACLSSCIWRFCWAGLWRAACHLGSTLSSCTLPAKPTCAIAESLPTAACHPPSLPARRRRPLEPQLLLVSWQQAARPTAMAVWWWQLGAREHACAARSCPPQAPPSDAAYPRPLPHPLPRPAGR